MTSIRTFVIGPRVPSELLRRNPVRYRLPSALMLAGALIFMLSALLPWWHMKLHAPQYPKGLTLEAHVNSMSGDVAEIDILNHYIGMRPLTEAAPLERKLAWFAVTSMAASLIAASFTRTWWAGIFSLPLILFPAVFLLDLRYWMHDFGMNLDPSAPLSNSIKPFSPPVLGHGVIGQFTTDAYVGTGLMTAVGAGVLTLVALWLHRRAFKPLLDQRRNEASLT